ncbi:hypothetical protein ABZ876_27695 [Streptomyces sp. NPDC046931]|uniref:hypothetical protein n=1 Tax=Streptomyces sp. NPDC046931 TaxID=3154806 RepID=UPI0033E1DD36
MASPAAAQSSTPSEALTGAVATNSANTAGKPTPVQPDTANSGTAETAAKGLDKHTQRKDLKKDRKAAQEIVRAVVQGDATLVAGQSFGATSVTRVENPSGIYQVCFDVPVTNGTYVATIGIPGNSGTSQPGEITVVGRVNTDNCLYVRTFNSAGTLEDRSFHVVVVYSK